MAKTSITKKALIEQANSMVVIAAGVAAFIFIFSIVASKALVSQAKYQNHVINAQHKALKQLKDDVAATNDLKASYDSFVNSGTNILGGSSTGNGAQDGTNDKLVLDALPSSYDFPALATSLEYLISSQNLTIGSISGTDDEVAQSSNTSSATPTPVAMPFEISVTGDYTGIQNLINEFEHSIRPFQIQTINISGDQDKLTANITAQTFYQPGKEFNAKKTITVK